MGGGWEGMVGDGMVDGRWVGEGKGGGRVGLDGMGGLDEGIWDWMGGWMVDPRTRVIKGL